eukprot:jgi/Mesvir1/26527/Mv16182-RA.1
MTSTKVVARVAMQIIKPTNVTEPMARGNVQGHGNRGMGDESSIALVVRMNKRVDKDILYYKNILKITSSLKKRAAWLRGCASYDDTIVVDTVLACGSPYCVQNTTFLKGEAFTALVGGGSIHTRKRAILGSNHYNPPWLKMWQDFRRIGYALFEIGEDSNEKSSRTGTFHPHGAWHLPTGNSTKDTTVSTEEQVATCTVATCDELGLTRTITACNGWGYLVAISGLTLGAFYRLASSCLSGVAAPVSPRTRCRMLVAGRHLSEPMRAPYLAAGQGTSDILRVLCAQWVAANCQVDLSACNATMPRMMISRRVTKDMIFRGKISAHTNPRVAFPGTISFPDPSSCRKPALPSFFVSYVETLTQIRLQNITRKAGSRSGLPVTVNARPKISNARTRRPGLPPTRAQAQDNRSRSVAQATQRPVRSPCFEEFLEREGITGLGDSEGALCITPVPEGGRGLVATRDLRAGEVVLTVPISACLSDEDEKGAPLYEGAFWSIKLAARLLRERAKGDASRWAAYIAHLPQSMATPLTFQWESLQAIRYAHAQQLAFELSWMATDAFDRCEGAAIGHATREEFDWALQIVHSRTLRLHKGGENGAPPGPSSSPLMRVLTPGLDLLNHSGDGAKAVWEVIWPSTGDGSSPLPCEGHIQVVVTEDVHAGEQLFISYGARNGDDFFLHYGFVPQNNLMEDCIVFTSLEEAFEWHARTYGWVSEPQESIMERWEAVCLASQSAGSARVGLDVFLKGGASLKRGSSNAPVQGRLLEEDRIPSRDADDGDQAIPLRVYAGGLVDLGLAAAFSALFDFLPEGAGEVPAELSRKHAVDCVATRCEQVLGVLAEEGSKGAGTQVATGAKQEMALVGAYLACKRGVLSRLLTEAQSVQQHK